jgi:hypothetical protein
MRAILCPAIHMMPSHQLWLAVFVSCTRGELWPAKKPLGVMLRTTLPVSGSLPILTPASPRAEVGLLCEGGCSLSRRPRADWTSNHRADVAELICSASKVQHPNLMKAVVALSHWSRPSALHHAGTRLSFTIHYLFHSKHYSKETGTKARQYQ